MPRLTIMRITITQTECVLIRCLTVMASLCHCPLSSCVSSQLARPQMETSRSTDLGEAKSQV
eukprot:scaffold170067_cov32-Tisochrysis_lutea.AAC.1